MHFRFRDRHFLYVIEFVLIAIAALLGPIFFLFGSLEAIINKDQTIFHDLITASFTMAGFTIAATAFAIKSVIQVKHLIKPTIVFLASGFLMYANILVVEFTKFDVDIAKNDTLRIY